MKSQYSSPPYINHDLTLLRGEYCSPVWGWSTHCRLIDTELRKGLRTITGTVSLQNYSGYQSWPTSNSHIFADKILYCGIADKIQNNPALPIHEDRVAMPKLKSRHPFLATLEVIKDRKSLQSEPWKKEWENDFPTNRFLVENVHRNLQGQTSPPPNCEQGWIAYASVKVILIIYRINGKSR